MEGKCFEGNYFDQCITYTGQSDSTINIEQGKSVAQTISNLVGEVAALKAQLNACGLCDGKQVSANIVQTTDSTINNYSLKSVSGPSQIPSNYKFNSNSITKDDHVQITYKSDDISGEQILSSKVHVEGMKNGYSSIIVSSDAMSGGFILAPNNFPATIHSEIKTLTSAGEKTYKTSAPLLAEGASHDTTYDYRSIGSVNPKTQTEVNSVLDENIVNLKNRVNKISNVNITGPINIPSDTNIIDAFYILYGEIVSLQKKIDELNNLSVPCISTDNCGKQTLSTVLNDMCGKISSTQNTIQSLGSNVNRLELNAGIGSGGTSSGGNTGSNTGGTTGGNDNPGNDPTIYAYCCSGSGCKKVDASSEDCPGTMYSTLTECNNSCNKGSGGSDDPNSKNSCDTIILYNQSDTCTDIAVELEESVLKGMPNSFTFFKSSNLKPGTSCGYVVKVKCGTKTSSEFRSNNNTAIENQVKAWIEGNCPCVKEDICLNIKDNLEILDNFNVTNKTINFQVTQGGIPVATKYERLHKTKVNAPDYISLSDLSEGKVFSVEFEVTIDGKVCKFVKDFTFPGDTLPCNLSITSATYNNPGLTVNLSGGTAPYVYRVDGIIIDIATVTLTNGSHTLLVKDTNNCSATLNFNVSITPTNCITVSNEVLGGTNKDCEDFNGSITPYTEIQGIVTFSIPNAIGTPLNISFNMTVENCSGISTNLINVIMPAGQTSISYNYLNQSAINCGGQSCTLQNETFKCMVSNSENYAYCPGIIC